MCGNDQIENDEQCDDGNRVGGDGCAENCTVEARHRFRIGLSSDSAFRRLIDQPQPLALRGELALTLGGLRASDTDLNVPVVIRADDLHFEPIVVPGVGCLCVRGVPFSEFGPGNLGGGLIGCGPFGPAGVGVDVHVLGDCAVPGPASAFDGSGPRGSTRLAMNLAMALLPDGGRCAGNDRVHNGPDGVPCTDDDPDTDTHAEVAFLSGTVRAEVFGDRQRRCVQGSDAHPSECAPELAGRVADCDAIAATPAGGLEGLVLVGAMPLSGERCGDLVGLQLRALPGGACVGDCDGDALVGIAELVCGVATALGGTCFCPGLDTNEDGHVAIDELVTALGFALAGCPVEPKTCETPDPVGCRVTGCPASEVCDVQAGCVPSSCACTASGSWTCTANCGGGVCVTPTPGITPTPTPRIVGDLGYVGVRGVVFDAARAESAPVAGATVHYAHSSLVRPGTTGDVATAADGRFKICLFLHDTATITLTADAPGFAPAARHFGGYFLYANQQPIEIGLMPLSGSAE